jgi:hypothetical protein
MDQRPRDERVALDEDPKNSTSAQERANLRNTLRDGPILDSLHTRRICNSAFVSTNMSKDISTRDTDKSLLPAERSSIGLHSLDNPMDSLEMLPDESPNTRIVGNGLVGTVGKLVARLRTFDRDIISKGLSPVRNLGS